MIGIFPHPYIHGHLYKILSASITASVAMSSLHHWFIAAILIGGPVSGFLLENGHRPNIIFLVADDLGECWLGSTYLSIAAKPAEFRILYNVSRCHGVTVSGCQGVCAAQLEEAWPVNHAVGRSSSGCAKLTKSLQQAFNPKIAEFFGSRPKLEGSVHQNIIVSTFKIHLCS